MAHDLVELGSRRGELHQAVDHPGESIGIGIGDLGFGFGEVGVELLEQQVDRGPPELLLRREVVVDLGLVGVDALRDGSRGRALIAAFAELDDRLSIIARQREIGSP
jgi:hypothetical protein